MSNTFNCLFRINDFRFGCILCNGTDTVKSCIYAACVSFAGADDLAVLCLQTESAASSFCAYYKRCRKFGGIMIGLTQDISDTLRTQQGEGIFGNSGTYVFFEQQALGQRRLQQLYPDMSDAMLDYVKGKGVGVGIMKTLTETVPINYRIPSDSLFYKIATTKPGES